MNLTFLAAAGSAGLVGLGYAARHVLPLPLGLALWHVAATGLAVSLASTEALAERSAGMFGKLQREDGHIPWLRWLLFWPFHVAVQAVMRGYRRLATEPLVSQIEDGWYLGGCPTRTSQLPPGPTPALLDVTCDMPRCLDAPAYKLLRAWETHGLNPQQIQEGVEWGLKQKKEGRPVLTYCTHGHGRSAVMLCALLIADGVASSTEEARQRVVRARPGAQPNSRQLEALERWYKLHGEQAATSRRE